MSRRCPDPDRDEEMANDRFSRMREEEGFTYRLFRPDPKPRNE